MNIAHLKSLRDKLPFAPFYLILDQGERIPVPHPEFLFLSPTNSVSFIVAGLNGETRFVETVRVERTEFMR